MERAKIQISFGCQGTLWNARSLGYNPNLLKNCVDFMFL